MYKTYSLKYEDYDAASMEEWGYVESSEFPTDVKLGYDVCESCVHEEMKHCIDCPVASYHFNPNAMCTVHRI